MIKSIELAIGICKQFEGIHLIPYECPAGIPTIGYGSTIWENGSRVKLTDSEITIGRAESLLANHLRKYCLNVIKDTCPNILKSINKTAAILDFIYNIGEPKFKSSTLLKKLLLLDWDSASKEILRWDRVGQQRLNGLTKRRKAEYNLFLKEDING
jgi:lysozyme